MSATLSISPFSNFLIITNFLHNYILYAFLFFSFYHKLTINHYFFDIFSFPPTVKQPLSVSLYRGVHIQSKIHPCLTVLPFGILFSYGIYLDGDLPVPLSITDVSLVCWFHLKVFTALFLISEGTADIEIRGFPAGGIVSAKGGV